MDNPNSCITGGMNSKLTFVAILLILGNVAAKAQFSTVQTDLPITAQQKDEIIRAIIDHCDSSYIFPEIAGKVEKALRIYEKQTDYAKIKSSKDFADTINNWLMRVSNDKHLRILFSHDTVPQKRDREDPLPDFIKDFAIENNYGFNKIDILEGDIGYMNILGFFPFEEATREAIAAFQFLETTRALIIDLRENSGGDAGLANFILSYFFDQKPVELMEAHFKKDNRVDKVWSAFYVPGKRYIGKPVFILTGPATFSGGEGFAYILQSLKRATVIGEPTGGGANFGDLVRINDHFVMNLPVGRPVSPVTQTNWEGIGVQPDIRVPREQALIDAHREALKRLIVITADQKTKNHLQEVLAKLQSVTK